jgi:hypothetical protein
MKKVFFTLCLVAIWFSGRAQVHEGHAHEGERDPARETPGALFEEMSEAMAAQPGERVLYKFTGVAPRFGLAMQKGLFAEAGIGLDIQRLGYTGASEFVSFGYSNLRPYLAGEIMAASHLLGGGKAGVEYIRSTPLVGMAFGGDVSYLTDGVGRAVLVTPRLVLSFVKVEVYYGYNFFVRNELTRWIGHHRFGVSMTLNPRFWRRKQQVYEEYYNSYIEE